MNAKKAKALRRLLRKQHVDASQRISAKCNTHAVKVLGTNSKGETITIAAVEAHTAYLLGACGRKVYKQLKKVAN